jgi:hypothetical protein
MNKKPADTRPIKNFPISMSKKVGAYKSHEINALSDFTIGYRSREDTSLLKPHTLVAGSFNVLSTTTGRISARKGYTLDGAGSSVLAGIKSSFDWESVNGYIHHLRSGFLTSAGNDGKLQLRYVDSSGNVSWLDLITGLSGVHFQYVNFWDSTAVRAYLLMVNGTSGIYEWTGAITTVKTATLNTITTDGTKTFAQLGFTATGSLIAGGVTFTYTGGTSTTTLTGVTGDASGLVAGTPIYQAPVFTAVGSMTFTTTPTPPTGFTFDLIDQVGNQVFFGSLNSNLIYMSKAGTYKDYSQSTARIQYEGDQFTTQGLLKAFIPEDDKLYISAGLDEWYYTDFVQTTITNQTTGTTTTFENATLKRLKTTTGQAAQAQDLVTKIKNNLVYVSYEPIICSLGNIANYLNAPQVVDISYPIVNDMVSYDFTGGSVFYNKQFVYVAIPKNGLFLMYNMTNPKDPYWEAPVTIPISCFSQVGNQVIGHSSLTSESYVLFNGYSDRAVDLTHDGAPINATAVFAFQTSGLRAKRKSFNKFFVEGYLSANTTLTASMFYRGPSSGLTADQSFIINGKDSYVLGQDDNNSLGKYSLGKEPLGGDVILPLQNTLPYYFAVIKTSTRFPYLNFQPVFSSYGINQPWEIVSFGTNESTTTENETDITV